jgi:hypothetical protein
MGAAPGDGKRNWRLYRRFVDILPDRASSFMSNQNRLTRAAGQLD